MTGEKAFDFTKVGPPPSERLYSSPPHEDNFSYEEDLERRVREAVKRSEEMIRQNSPNRYSQSNLEPYVKYYLESDAKSNLPIINTIPPKSANELNPNNLSGHYLASSASQKFLRPEKVEVAKSNSFIEPSSSNFRDNYLYTVSGGGGSDQAMSGLLNEDYGQVSSRHATLYTKATPRQTGAGSTQWTNRQTYASIGDTNIQNSQSYNPPLQKGPFVRSYEINFSYSSGKI